MRERQTEDDVNVSMIAGVVGKVTHFIDDHVREIQYGFYGLGVVGIVVIAKRIYLFKRFSSARDIPASFFTRNVRLQGQVRHVSPSGVLYVQHEPIVVARPFVRKTVQKTKKSPAVNGSTHSFLETLHNVIWTYDNFENNFGYEGLLAVQLGGVDVRPGGGAWLQSHMTSKHIWFTLLRVHPENGVDAIVKAKKNLIFNYHVNEEIIRNGLGMVKHMEGLEHNKTCLRFSERLIKAEMYAEHKGRGIWTKPSLIDSLLFLPRMLTGAFRTVLERKELIGKRRHGTTTKTTSDSEQKEAQATSQTRGEKKDWKENTMDTAKSLWFFTKKDISSVKSMFKDSVDYVKGKRKYP